MKASKERRAIDTRSQKVYSEGGATMITEPAVPVSAVPAEIAEAATKLHTDVEKLQRELPQALEVWQSTLAAENNHFENLLQHKELAWKEQEDQWAKQSQAYEERLEVMKSDFEARLKQTEQNAAHALAELDDDWQRDKLDWGPKAEGADQHLVLEEKVRLLERELADLKAARAKTDSAGPTPATVKALQDQLLEFQQTVASFQGREARSDELVNACVQALDYQISVLYDLLQHYTSETSGVGPPNGEPRPLTDGPPSDLVQP
jgi:lipid II:glycine glycyltransferase (peptidoglycan interpeptide bridge formation enzyme)